jgi:hypothetical protein
LIQSKQMQRRNINTEQNQFIVNKGIVYNKRDILMLLRDLGFVTYREVVKNKILEDGRGYIMRVYANSEEPTLFLNGRIYINVWSFDYLKLSKAGDKENTLFELCNEQRIIQIVPEETSRSFPAVSKEVLADRVLGLERLGDIAAESFSENPGDLDNPPISDDWFEN